MAENSRVNLMNAAPRCTATSKRTRLPCRAPALTGWTVCRFHGARGGAPAGKEHGAYKHGLRSKEIEAERRAINEMVRAIRKATNALPDT
jgi:hypothetical protein